MIKLTNKAQEHEGKPLLINPKHILSVFETTREVEGKKKTIEIITNIYMITQQSWQVQESLEDVFKMINSCKGKCHD